MSNLINETPEASNWIDSETPSSTEKIAFGRFIPAVIWTDEPDTDGNPIGVADPSRMISQINIDGWPLYQGHDPGKPSGRVIAASLFVSPRNRKFVAAILGFYTDEKRLQFSDLGVEPNPDASSPSELGEIPSECWLDIAVDPREVDSQWLEDVLKDPPLPVVQQELSHNAEDWQQELIRIGLVYATIVWNPLITTISQEAAKDVYAGVQQWLRNLWNKLASRKDPIVEISSYQDGCCVSFFFRGKDVKNHYDAHDALPIAAAQAEILIKNMKSYRAEPSNLVYEFDTQSSKWFPSHAILRDGRLVSDRNILIAIEQHSAGLSIGIHKERKRLPKHR